jgi:hypothetical protein
MNKLLPVAAVAATLAAALFAPPAIAQEDAAVVISAPPAWGTLRTDSVVVSLQADTAALPKGSVDFKVVKRSGARSSTLFSKSVKVVDGAADVFLGRASGLPVGGRDFLSIEWSVPGTDLKGVVEPVGIVKLGGKVTADKKWEPASPRLAAVKLEDGISGERAAEALAALAGSGLGGGKVAAGWNSSGLFVNFAPGSPDAVAEFAFDLKCGGGAFLAWADKFVASAADSAYGQHLSSRRTDKDGLQVEESPWGGEGAITQAKSGDARLISVNWSELGIQPFEGRAIGFAAFAKSKGRETSYPASAVRTIPGTWGGIELTPPAPPSL